MGSRKQEENDFLQELVSALEHCHKRIQAMADAMLGSTDAGVVLTKTYMHGRGCISYMWATVGVTCIEVPRWNRSPLIHPGAVIARERRAPSARERHVAVEQCAMECARRGA